MFDFVLVQVSYFSAGVTSFYLCWVLKEYQYPLGLLQKGFARQMSFLLSKKNNVKSLKEHNKYTKHEYFNIY